MRTRGTRRGNGAGTAHLGQYLRHFTMVVRRRPTLPHTRVCSTIGAGRLNFRVRYGTGCFPFAMVAVTLWRCVEHALVPVLCTHPPFMVVGVCVGWVCYCLLPPAYQPSHLLGALPGCPGGKPHLETSFPLRCFQRLSLPNVANQPCSWQNNWHTRGSSIPVLSY